jgi:hypothetical protein
MGTALVASPTLSGHLMVADSEAMLFNLSQQRYFPHSQEVEFEIGCASNWGPCFTGGNQCELAAWNEPFNGDGNCASWANHSGY